MNLTRRKFLKAIGIASLVPSVIPKLIPMETVSLETVPIAVKNYGKVLESTEFVRLLDKRMREVYEKQYAKPLNFKPLF